MTFHHSVQYTAEATKEHFQGEEVEYLRLADSLISTRLSCILSAEDQTNSRESSHRARAEAVCNGEESITREEQTNCKQLSTKY